MQFDQDAPWEKTRCFNEQGYLCMGPVTRGGCAGLTTEDGEPRIPRCIKGYMPCRGCFGFIHKDSDQLVDMVNLISSIGLDPKQIADRKPLLYRYVGSQGRLTPKGTPANAPARGITGSNDVTASKIGGKK